MSRYIFIVPSRNRQLHQEKFIVEFPQYLDLQKSYMDDYKIVFINQSDSMLFNLGWNINVGFDLFEHTNDLLEYDYDENDRIVFHPVDGIPVDLLKAKKNKLITTDLHGIRDIFPINEETISAYTRSYDNINAQLNFNSDELALFTPASYSMLQSPQPYWSTYATYYKALGMGRNAYRSINGHTNSIWGWGCDDDDLLWRALVRPAVTVSRIPVLWNWYYESHQDHSDKNGMILLNKLWNDKGYVLRGDGLDSLSYEYKCIKLSSKIYQINAINHNIQDRFGCLQV